MFDYTTKNRLWCNRAILKSAFKLTCFYVSMRRAVCGDMVARRMCAPVCFGDNKALQVRRCKPCAIAKNSFQIGLYRARIIRLYIERPAYACAYRRALYACAYIPLLRVLRRACATMLCVHVHMVRVHTNHVRVCVTVTLGVRVPWCNCIIY